MSAPPSRLLNEAVLQKNAYTLVSITRAKSPVESDDRDWHRYVITQGENRIVGHVPGSMDSARATVTALVAQLNDRRQIKPGRVQLTVGSSSKS